MDFYNGQKLSHVIGPVNPTDNTCTYHMLGADSVTAITVIREDGTECPWWAYIEREGKPNCKVNLAKMEEVFEARKCKP